MPKRNTELDILRIVRDHGSIMLYVGDSSEGVQWLNKTYVKRHEVDQLITTFRFLVESGHLLPFTKNGGEVVNLTAQGITPKGEDRLYALEHRCLARLKRNSSVLTMVCTSLVSAAVGSLVTVLLTSLFN